ncbi:hypothetical protein V8E53_004238 [Lactarius tabidus]
MGPSLVFWFSSLKGVLGHCLPFNMLSAKLPAIVSSSVIWSLVFIFIVFKVYLTFVKAVIIILKHATLLRLSNLSRPALARADMDYRSANIDSTIYQFLMAFPEPSPGQRARFIMATEIVPPQPSAETGASYY